MVGHAQVIRNASRKPPKAHTYVKRQANDAARAANSNPPTMPLYMHLTRTSGLLGCCGPYVGPLVTALSRAPV